MSKKNQPFKPDRRTFMRTIAFSGGTAVMLGGAGISVASVAERDRTTQAESLQQQSSGYHLTEHIREYYRKAAF